MADPAPLPGAAGAPRSLWVAYGFLVALLGRFWIFGRGGATDVADAYGLRAVVFAAVLSGLVLLHGRKRLGDLRLAAGLLLVYAVSLGVEVVGVSRGWPFGRYAYAPAFPGKLFGLVPAVVPWIWAVLTYLAFATTEAILGPPQAGARAPWTRAARRAVLTAFLLLAYDLVADPNHVVRGGWAFDGGGSYFGVPVHNFLGWVGLGWFLGLVLHRLAPAPGGASRGSDGVLALAQVTVLVHESLFATRIAGLHLPAAVGAVESAGVILLVPRLRRAVARSFRLARPAWNSLRPAEAMRGTVFVLAGFGLSQPPVGSADFDVAGLVACLVGGFAGAAAVLAYNSYEGRRTDRLNRRLGTHPLVTGELTAGQQLAVALGAGAVSLASFALYRPLSALAVLGALAAGALYSANRLRGKERAGVPTVLHAAGSGLYFWAGAGAAMSSPVALTTAVGLALLFVAGHFHHIVIDATPDRAAGLQTLAVRRGPAFASTCSAALFLAFYLLAVVSGARAWWPWEMAAPFLAAAPLHAAALAVLRPWRASRAAERYCAFYRALFVVCGALALLGWWSGEPGRAIVTAMAIAGP